MTVEQLIKALSKFNPDRYVRISCDIESLDLDDALYILGVMEDGNTVYIET